MYQFPSVYDSTMSVNIFYWQTSYCDIASSVDITMVAKVYIMGGSLHFAVPPNHYEVSKSYQHKRHHGTYPYPDSKVHGANMGPIWGRQDPGGPHVGPMNLAIRVSLAQSTLDSNSGISVPEDDLAPSAGPSSSTFTDFGQNSVDIIQHGQNREALRPIRFLTEPHS